MKSTLKIFCALLSASPVVLWLDFDSIKSESTTPKAASTENRKRTSFYKPPATVSGQKPMFSTKPRPFDVRKPIAFIHVGKNAGSSMDLIFAKAKSVLHFQYVGGKHFDLSYARKKIPTAQGEFD